MRWVGTSRTPIEARAQMAYRRCPMQSRDKPRTYRVKSFGCQMNVYDGERMAEMLGEQGITPASQGEEADLVVLNTCHIREKAAEKVYSDIGRLAKAGRKSGQRADDRGRGLRGGRPRARKSCGALRRCRWWSDRRPIIACPR